MYRERDVPELASLEDGALVERSKRGDADAYGELVRRYQGLAQRTAYVITRDADAAADASQEAFVKAYRAIGRFRGGAPLRPWLLRIVANEAVNRTRSAARHGHAALSLAERVADPSGTPEEATLARERREAVIQALDRMRDEDRTVIAYRYFFEMSEAEMADALGVARGTVKSRLSRALARLRELM